MIKPVFTHLKTVLKTAGCRDVFDDPAAWKRHKVLPMSVVQFNPAERFERDGRVYRVQDTQTGVWSIFRSRKKRLQEGLIHIGGRTDAELETILTAFLDSVGYGTYNADGLWIDIEISSFTRAFEQSILKDARLAEIGFTASGGAWVKQTVGEIAEVVPPQISINEGA